MNKKTLSIRFWGTRGSLAPKRPSQVFGIHTTCAEIISPRGAPILFDLGGGATLAGAELIRKGTRQFEVFLTHLHSDHVCGAYGFFPFFKDDCNTRIRCAGHDPRAVLSHLFENGFHPVDFSQISNRVECELLPPTGSITFDEQEVSLSWAPIPHPQGCTAFRIDDGQNAIVFATDVELSVSAQLDGLRRLLTVPYPAGLAAIDGFLAPEQLKTYKGWGHSSWDEAIKIAEECDVQTVVIIHHHPDRTEDELLKAAEARHPAAWARDGDIFTLCNNCCSAAGQTL